MVDVATTFERESSSIMPEMLAGRAILQSEIDGLAAAKIQDLYLNPPTTVAKIEELIANVKGAGAAACDASDVCRRDMIRIRVQDLETPEDLQTWDAAFAS